LSITVSVARYVPAEEYACEVVDPAVVAVAPSPKVQKYSTMAGEGPTASLSCEAEPLNATLWLTLAGLGVAVKLAVGSAVCGPSSTVICRMSE
jgi:hypothetical protein